MSIGVHLWLNLFPRLGLFQELDELPQGGRQLAAFAVDGGHRHGVTSVLNFLGLIDEVGIYNHALSASEIRAIYVKQK